MFTRIGLAACALMLGSVVMAADKPAANARQQMESGVNEPEPTVTEYGERQPIDVGYHREAKGETRVESREWKSRGTTKPAAEARQDMER